MVAGIDSNIQHTNVSGAAMFGRTPAECVGLDLAGLMHPEDAASAKDVFAQLTCGEISSHRSEVRFRRKDGTLFSGRMSAATAADERTGEPVHLIIELQDIEELTRAKSALVANESRWDIALEGAGQGVWTSTTYAVPSSIRRDGGKCVASALTRRWLAGGLAEANSS